MAKEKYVKICPKCGSLDIGLYQPMMLSIGIDEGWFCKDCNYRGIFPEIEKSEIEVFRKKLKK